MNTAERLALSLAPSAMPASWQVAAQNGTVGRPAAGRNRRSLIVATMISLLALTWVLALDLFTVRAGEPGAVFFSAGTSEAQAFAAIITAGGLPIRATTSVFSEDAVVWIAAADDPDFFSTIIGKGALVVINPLAFNACFLRSDT